MLNRIKKAYFGSGIGTLILVISSLLMIVVSIIYMIIDFGSLKLLDGGDKTLVFLMFLLGGIIGLLTPLVPVKLVRSILPLVPAAMFAIGAGRMVYLTIYPLSDEMTGVKWWGGSLPLYMTFLILFLIGTLGVIVANFLKDPEAKAQA